MFSDPERLKPGKTRQALTEEAAADFAKLAQRLRDRGHPAETVAHFINRLIFCMFAEDVDLLPNKMFKRMLEHAATQPAEFRALASDLFKAMQFGGRVGFEQVAWFNGGLFNDNAALSFDGDDIAIALKAARLDWAEVDRTEAAWPDADVIIGNPPFLGDKFMRDRLGSVYTENLRQLYAGRVPGGADLVCYWFAKSAAQLIHGKTKRVGLVATNSIRGGANRYVLDRITDELELFESWSDEPWVVDGAAVRVSLICFASKQSNLQIRLNGKAVSDIFADLTAGSVKFK